MSDGITESVKAQLMWSIGDEGSIDADVFFTILAENHVGLGPREIDDLCREMTARYQYAHRE